MITKITGKNQVTVPAKIVAQAKIKPGSRLDWRQTKRKHILEVRILPDKATLATELRGRGSKYKNQNTNTVANLIRERATDESERNGG